MTHREPAPAAAPHTRSPASPPTPAGAGRGDARLGLTAFGCGPDEVALFRRLAPRFGVMPTITEAAASEATSYLAHGKRCVSIDHKTPVTGATLRALSLAGVEYISTRSIGGNHIDLEEAARLGITVENVSYSPDSVADYALMLVLMVVRDARSTILRADGHDYRLNDSGGKELRDLTIGVVGTGRIGAAVVRRLRGFGSRILTFDRRPGAPVEHVPLEELLSSSDVVTLHTPLTAETHHLLNRRRIGLMKPGAFLINTGRGGLVDTGALVAALEAGRLGGAALDVLEGEEGIFYTDCRGHPVGNELLVRLQTMPKVLISPHAAYHTEHALTDMVEGSIANCLRFEQSVQHG